MSENLIGKFVLSVSGDVLPLFATKEQWSDMSAQLKNGKLPVQTSKGTHVIFGVLEVAKGYGGKGFSTSEDGILMLFGEKEGAKSTVSHEIESTNG